MAFCKRCKKHLRDVNPKNLAQLESNDMNNKSALVKHVGLYLQNHRMNYINLKNLAKETDYTKITFLKSFLIQIIMLLITKPIVFIQLLITILKFYFFFFFRLLPTRGRHSATVISISLDLLLLLP